jgi:hypothetical protein
VQHSRGEGISGVDVSEPAKPKVVRVIPWPDPAVSSHMSVTGNLALISENEPLPVHDATTKDDLVLWDLIESSRSSSGEEILRGGQVFAGQSQFHLRVE